MDRETGKKKVGSGFLDNKLYKLYKKDLIPVVKSECTKNIKRTIMF